MKITQRKDWPGGPPRFELDLLVPVLLAGGEIGIIADAYGSEDEDVDFGISVPDVEGGPLIYFDIASLTKGIIARFPDGHPLIRRESRLRELGIEAPGDSLNVLPQAGIGLYSVRFAIRWGQQGDLRIRAHGYRVSDGTLSFYLKLPQPGATFDIAAVALDLLDGEPQDAVAELGDG